MKLEKEQKDEVEKLVHSITDKEMGRTRVTQCKKDQHRFRKLTENEVACTICPTVLIVDPDKLKDFIK